ncbi:serine/threonine protein kinase [Streptomyces sp. TLI_55]|uniref:serine/threonine-protein kinase n=1 Tax=Streptomyces sp. TLI_55 TaxID=1938861 RepID=UPI000BCB04A1|nr:serine/threonine-protein kinase [Streptomyces sp. TLI_55]SNX62230.1 serine/threonine protein kinase [Streptomyces sp. TLI_55]
MDALRERDPAHIGAYTLLARLGAGGMGQVYLARSPGGRLVAVKVIRDEITDHPEALARFRREVETVRAVRSAYTANLIDASLDAAPYWLATEYVAGPTLSGAVGAHGPLPADSARRLFAALAEALASVHVYGVTHRDLKPQNVLLSPQGPQLIDFGIARGAADTALTQTGLTPGTPGYSAPEVIVGNQVGPAADVFALGATLAYAVTGRPPFGSGPTHAVSYRVVHEDIDVAGVEPGLAALIQECVAKEPGARPGPAAVIARCAVSSALAEDPLYGRLAADSVVAPSDLRAAVAAGLVPLGHGAPAAPAHRPTVGPGYVPTYVPTTVPEPPRRSRRTSALVAVSVAAVLVAGSVVAWRMQGGQDDGGAEAQGGGTASASASGSATAFKPPSYILGNKASRDFWKLSNDPAEAAEGRGDCAAVGAKSAPMELQYSATDADSPDGGNVRQRAKITFRFKYAELQKQKPAPYYVSVGVKSPRDFDPETGTPYEGDVNRTIGATSRPADIFTHWKEGGAVELVYPDDFQEHLPNGKAYDAVPVADDPGDWTVVFYHLTGSRPTDQESIGCDGFHVGSS